MFFSNNFHKKFARNDFPKRNREKIENVFKKRFAKATMAMTAVAMSIMTAIVIVLAIMLEISDWGLPTGPVTRPQRRVNGNGSW